MANFELIVGMTSGHNYDATLVLDGVESIVQRGAFIPDQHVSPSEISGRFLR